MLVSPWRDGLDKFHGVLTVIARTPVPGNNLVDGHLGDINCTMPSDDSRVSSTRYPQHLGLYFPPTVGRDIGNPGHETGIGRVRLALVCWPWGPEPGAGQVVTAAWDG